MSSEDLILELLDTSDPKEFNLSKDLRNQANFLLSSRTQSIHQDLLTQIIKPIFSKTHHPAITSTGRKDFVSVPSLPSTFGTDSIFSPPPLWHNTWTAPLLQWIIQSHSTLSDLSRRKTLEANFHLLVPAILNLIDDTSIPFKVDGCKLLTSLCTLLKEVQSDILKRTGLSDVFIDALKGCFHYLPTLTPEDESLRLLKALYPAYLALVEARFVVLGTYTTAQSQSEDTRVKTQLSPAQVAAEITARNNALAVLLRYSLLYTLAHLRVGDGGGGSSCPAISTFMIGRIPAVMEGMQGYASAHLKDVVPVLVGVLKDPFSTTEPEMLGAAVEALIGVVQICWARVRDRWWVEILRGSVEAWLNVSDDLVVQGKGGRGSEGIMSKVQTLIKLLRSVVGENFENAAKVLVEEESELMELFQNSGTI